MSRLSWIPALLIPLCAASGADVEIRRDRWGIPHIYAKSTDDLFYAQGYMAAKDRLFQLDLWRRQGTGKLAEVMGPDAIPRDRIARLVRYRGNMDAEWASYAPDAKQIATEFTNGINAYIHSLNGRRPPEFEFAGYDPGEWQPEDVLARVAGLLMTRNARAEMDRVRDIRRFGLERVQQLLPPDPFIRIELPKGIDLERIADGVLRDYNAAIEAPRFQAEDAAAEQGSNNWVVDGSMTASGKPLLANDPHRPVLLPSLRKTWHLVAPGINVFGAGEPALPGIALGHNERIAWGFTIVGIDQQDLYVETLNPDNPAQYRFRGEWRAFEVEHQDITVKGRTQPENVELRYTVHGPVIYEDRARGLAYALKWVGAEPGGAGYLAALSLMRARGWDEFLKAAANYKVPSENLAYADVDGNIGWIAAGWAPIRKNWSGLLPVPGDSGEYEWAGYVPSTEMPRQYNPSRHYIATANQKILPENYPYQLSFEWALPFRFLRIEQMLGGRSGLGRTDFERMQQDVTSVPVRRFQTILRAWRPSANSAEGAAVAQMLAWDGRLRVDSREALIYEVWMQKLAEALFADGLSARVSIDAVLSALAESPQPRTLDNALSAALADLEKRFPDRDWKWGRLHQIVFRHPSGNREWDRGPFARPGDASTVNAASGARFQQTNGASYRQIIDLSNWDRSVMTNVPGESGDPTSRHYDDLIESWMYGVYHQMAYTRDAVERNTVERYLIRRK
jgi:penicillin amidase